MELTVLGDDRGVRICEHDAADGWVRVAGALPENLFSGCPVELKSNQEAPLLAARLITKAVNGQPLPLMTMRLATTRGTNALLERAGARVAHFITAGFEDLLKIGDQRRPDLFALHIEKPSPLPEIVIGVHERLAADGSVIEEMDRASLTPIVANLLEQGISCASITLLHGHRNPVHEQELEQILAEAGFGYVARSSALSPFQGLLRRSETCTVDAYLGPVISDYLLAVGNGLGGRESRLQVMTSAGGLVDSGAYRSMDSLLSGPAGGVVGAALVGRRCNRPRVIAFDMGGTSTDVSRFDGDFEYVFSHRVGPVELAVPALAIETVAAGGGSICRVDQGRLSVGPESAGAMPGPASYGAGGPLTLTDVNLLLGRLVAERFPIPIDLETPWVRFRELREELEAAGRGGGSDEEILEGLLRIADERMAEAIRHISVRKGVDPSGYALVAFGGAGGQHACRLAEILGMEEIFLPVDAGLLSALGLGHAVVERFAQREVLRRLDEVSCDLDGWVDELAAKAAAELTDEGVVAEAIDRRVIVELRYEGQDATLEVEPTPGEDIRRLFEGAYYRLFSYRPTDRGIEVVSLRVVASSRRPDVQTFGAEYDFDLARAHATRRQRCFIDGGWRDVPLYEASELAAGSEVTGPALVQQDHSALVVRPGWRARSLGDGSVRLKILKTGSAADRDFRTSRPKAVELELMSHRFSSIAREMGEILQRTAISTNIKEREDFSCTLLDPAGRLVVNAPHIPVHLGAMGLCVRELVDFKVPDSGDVVVTNHPAFGGSHLPDVTLAAPVHIDDRLLGYVACRAHHAEIGGVRPGSVPPNATSLAEEGVVIPPTLILEQGEPQWERIERLLREGPYPSRTPADNMADLRAMLAAILRGREGLTRLAQAVGCDHVQTHMDGLRRQAAWQIEAALERMGEGRYEGLQFLDDGSPLVAALTVRGNRAVLDFTGSAKVHGGNLNATPAIVHSVVMYVLRLLVDVELPLNEGLLEPIEIRIPRGLLNPGYDADPVSCPAVVGGNVETSQRLTDTLLEALGLAGCSQGTMNNLTFGDESFGYYETVGGGSGAVAGRDGASGVHTHMTNTRITDPEVIEHRYPVRLRRFAIRRGSGGSGRWIGGDGLVREIEFLAPLELSILSQHRVYRPYGAAGGREGEAGRQAIVGADGVRRELEGIDGCEVNAGDRLILETPGGGGYG
ncbi:MAG: hydantoinase B/oxoprolinase family protein, partial [Acidobacteria bacterium]|nr:hydantoinase B/oxoprolinase family protein [Acidobacteriota bacterium]